MLAAGRVTQQTPLMIFARRDSSSIDIPYRVNV